MGGLKFQTDSRSTPVKRPCDGQAAKDHSAGLDGGCRSAQDIGAMPAEGTFEIASGRKSGADMVRLYGVSQPTVSRIVAAHLAGQA